MSLLMRIVLIAGSLVTAGFILYKIRKSKVRIEDSIFWLLFSAVLLILSVFPEIAIWLSSLLSFQSPINCVYLIIIAVLIIKLFSLSARLSQMESKMTALAQNVAINEYEIGKKK